MGLVENILPMDPNKYPEVDICSVDEFDHLQQICFVLDPGVLSPDASFALFLPHDDGQSSCTIDGT